jgi:hypothetical protein
VVGAENLNVGRHVVQFYGRDEELTERVTGYLLGALASGGVAIVIATPEHRRGFETRLGQAGVDLAAARDDGSYLARDAAQTLSELMAAGKLDGAAFDRVIGTVIVGGRPGTARPFAFSREAPAEARHFAVATLNAWGAGDLAGDVALVVTELAANAIVHARSAFTVILSVHGGVLRISVRDTVPLDGAGLRPAPLHGLAVVDALASRWGVESLGNAGKTVWVDLLR